MARSTTRARQLAKVFDLGLLRVQDGNLVTGSAVTDSATVTAISLDSAEAIALIDSAYVQARQDFAYSSLTGVPAAGTDSASVIALINEHSVDSAEVTSLIDSAYVALRAPSGGTDSATVLSLISANSLDSSEVTGLIDSAYVEARQNFAYGALTGKPNILDSANIINLVDSAYVQLRQSSVGTGGIDSAAANTLIDAKVQVLDIADIVGTSGNSGEYLKSLGNGNAEWSTISAGTDSATVISLINTNSIDSVGVLNLIDSAYVAARTSAGTDSASVIALINEHSVDSTEALALFTGGTGVTISTGTISIGQAIGTSDSVTFAGLTVSGNLTVNGTTTTVNTETINLADNIIVINSNEAGTPSQNGGVEVERGTSTNVSLLWNETSDRWTFTNDGSTYHNLLIGGEYLDSTTVTGVIDATYIQANQTTYDFLDSAEVISLIDSAYVQARQSSVGSGGLDSAAANTLIDAKVQVLDIADIVGSTGNTGQYLKSLGNGNASWENVTSVVDSAYVAARVGTTLATWQKISANYTLSAGDRIAVNTDSAWTMTLPASPTFSDEVYIIDATGNAATKNITVSGNSQKILASDSDLIINVNRASVAMMFYGDSQGWILTSAF